MSFHVVFSLFNMIMVMVFQLVFLMLDMFVFNVPSLVGCVFMMKVSELFSFMSESFSLEFKFIFLLSVMLFHFIGFGFQEVGMIIEFSFVVVMDDLFVDLNSLREFVHFLVVPGKSCFLMSFLVSVFRMHLLSVIKVFILSEDFLGGDGCEKCSKYDQGLFHI